ncbi:unnamed protein product [Peniophora sp. CBMAI 1063]|nr:unnamed protein product [Peniophora sp. CBMAI 1063]
MKLLALLSAAAAVMPLAFSAPSPADLKQKRTVLFLGDYEHNPERADADTVLFLGDYERNPDQDIEANTVLFLGDYEKNPDDIKADTVLFLGDYEKSPDA